MSDPHIITTSADAKAYILGGRATFTLRSVDTDKHYTYTVRCKGVGKPAYVRVHAGDERIYIGYIPYRADQQHQMIGGMKGSPDHMAFKALDWLLRQLNTQDYIPVTAELWHDGTCGRCGRQLTDPVSIQRGLGPHCAAYLGLAS